jgi:hypothetical protein
MELPRAGARTGSERSYEAMRGAFRVQNNEKEKNGEASFSILVAQS